MNITTKEIVKELRWTSLTKFINKFLFACSKQKCKQIKHSLNCHCLMFIEKLVRANSLVLYITNSSLFDRSIIDFQLKKFLSSLMLLILCAIHIILSSPELTGLFNVMRWSFLPLTTQTKGSGDEECIRIKGTISPRFC